MYIILCLFFVIFSVEDGNAVNAILYILYTVAVYCVCLRIYNI